MLRFSSTALSIILSYGILWLFDLDGFHFLLGLLFLCLMLIQLGHIRRKAPLTTIRVMICLMLLPIGGGLVGLSVIVATGSYTEAVVLNRQGKVVQRVPLSSVALKRPAQSYTYVPKELLRGENYEVEGVVGLSNGATAFYRLNAKATLDMAQIERILAQERQQLTPGSFVRSFQRAVVVAIGNSSAGDMNDPTYFDHQLRSLLAIELQESLKGYLGAVDIEILEMVILPQMEEPGPELQRAYHAAGGETPPAAFLPR